MSNTRQGTRPVILALGANLPSRWGEPPATFARALRLLHLAGFCTQTTSSLYRTQAIGPGLQDTYFNAVVVGVTATPPAALLRAAKRIEREAGRRRGRLWGPRPLDIDVIDYKGLLLGREPRRREPGQLLLPHPELHTRSFVLVPLAEAAPQWRHPRSGLSAATLLQRLPPDRRAGVGSRLAFPASTCDNTR